MIKRAQLENEAHALSRDDVQDKIDGIKWITEDLVPRFFVGAFVIAVAAAYESAAFRSANYVQRKASARIKISDLREANMRKKLELYMSTVMGESFALPEGLSARIDELMAVRNCLAHANGELSLQNEKRREALETLAKTSSGVTIRDGFLLVDESFGRAYLRHAANAVNAMLELVHRRYSVKPQSP